MNEASTLHEPPNGDTITPPPPPLAAVSPPAAPHDGQQAVEPAPKAASRGGAPRGNTSATRSGLAGSKLPAGCANAERAVLDLVNRVRAAWAAKHGDGPMPLAAEVLLKRIRRAEERDRVSAKQLRDGCDLKKNPLSFDQQERLRDAQESAGRIIEEAVKKLGLSAVADGTTDKGNGWNDFYREQAEAAAAARSKAADGPPVASDAGSVQTSPSTAEVPPANAEKLTDEMED